MPSLRLRLRTSVLATAAISLFIAGCGSNSSAPSGASASSGQATGVQSQEQAVRFSGCMQSHRVPNFPSAADPHAFKNALNPSSPGAQSHAFESAYTTCRHLLPNGGVPPAAAPRSPAQIAAFLAFAGCIRSHGFPNFPDPSSTGELNHQMVAAAGVNLHQPAVLQAGDACVPASHGFITKADVARFVAGQ
jgi:hypothetical protein